MRTPTPRTGPQRTWPVALLTLGALVACSGEQEPTPLPGPDPLDTARTAAQAAGADPRGGVGGDAQQRSSATFGPYTGGTAYGAFAACTGGGSVQLDLAGTPAVLQCGGQGHRVGEVVLPNDTPTFAVTRPNEVPSAWGAVLTMR